MKDIFNGEKWATIKFKLDYTNDMRLEVSNFGHIRSFTKLSDGKHLKGTMIGGYRCINLKFFKPRDSKTENRLNYFKTEINKLSGVLSPLRTKLKTKKKKDKFYLAQD